MKVTLVYTNITPELTELVGKEVGDVLPWETEVVSYQNPSILAEVRDAGYVTAPLAARLMGMYMIVASEGADVILNPCSFAGEVADATQGIARYMGIPTVRVDEEVCREVVRQGKGIGVMATLLTTLNPTKNTILRVVRETNRQVELMDALVDDGLGLDQEQFRDLMSEYAGIIAGKADVTLFAQGFMAYCEEYTHEKYGKVVLSSPRFGVVALKDALVKKGLMQQRTYGAQAPEAHRPGARNEGRGEYV